ncbi:helix-turn-helix transcriptional regulator [Catellatospora sp. NPDC049111]|uniref:helix-turn-helix domain-containing protein n=1 Tax=Catellatospora sp. NPDC049111 TaxID=3155271 RepID=UPI0033F87C9C
MVDGADLRRARRYVDVTLEHLASQGGKSPGHLSRVEGGRREVTPNIVALYERVLGFRIGGPDDPSVPTVGDVDRRSALKLAGAAVFGGAAVEPVVAEVEDTAQWLAWEIWHRASGPAISEAVVPGERIPAMRQLVAVRQVLRDPDGLLRFSVPGLIDFHIASRVFGGIATGRRGDLETVQTSHETDQIIRGFVERDTTAADTLGHWMRAGATPVLRVNSAGILAKLRTPEAADAVAGALRTDESARHLYLAAVAHRVLGLPWNDALRYAATPSYTEDYAARLVNELCNPRDPAARWCSAVLLGHMNITDRDPVKAAIAENLRTEDSRENLRTMAALLAEADPVTA